MRRNPTELDRTLSLEQVSVYRHPLCVYEIKCLNKAVKKDWKGFSCEKCFYFKRYKKKFKLENEIHIVYVKEIWEKNHIVVNFAEEM